MQNVSLIMPLCFQNRRQSFHLLMLLTGINGKYEDDFIQALILNLSLTPLNCFINIRKKNLIISIWHILWQSLYDLGARKFGIVSIAPIGCCPLERALGTGECNKEMNDLAQAFFNATEILLLNLTSQVQDMKYSLGNLYEIAYEVLHNPRSVGKYFILTKNFIKNARSTTRNHV